MKRSKEESKESKGKIGLEEKRKKRKKKKKDVRRDLKGRQTMGFKEEVLKGEVGGKGGSFREFLGNPDLRRADWPKKYLFFVVYVHWGPLGEEARGPSERINRDRGGVRVEEGR